jgi:hypothetical protein
LKTHGKHSRPFLGPDKGFEMTPKYPKKYALAAFIFFRAVTENQLHSLLRKMLLIGILASIMVACASSLRITTNTNPTTDFASFETYNFMPVLGTDRPNGVQTPLSAMLMSAMSREMSSRGYQRSDDPDLLINFFVNTEERMDVRQVPAPNTFHDYRFNRYATWGGYRTEVRRYTRGTLAIDLVDARQNLLAWEGIAQQRLDGSARQITQELVDDVVRQLMAEFIHSAR